MIPALAVARALADERGPRSVELVGSRRGLDSELVRDTGLPFVLLPGRGLSRRLSVRSVLENLFAVGALAVAWLVALSVVARRRPAVVVAIGGYACVPPAFAAVVLGVPLVLVNVDAVPGAANRLVGRFAKASAVAFEGTSLPRAVVTGAPVREEVRQAARPHDADRREARRLLGVPEEQRLLVGAVGGSLGSKRLNEAVLGLARMWWGRSDAAIYHVVGRRDAAWAHERIPREHPAGLWYRQVPYEEQMALFYEASDIVVCRAGANTVAELTVVGVPAIVVPLPGSPGDHQAANAAVLERAGAAVVVEDAACTGDRLAAELDRLFADEQRVEAMRDAAADLGRPDALSSVVSLVESHALGRARAHGASGVTSARPDRAKRWGSR